MDDWSGGSPGDWAACLGGGVNGMKPLLLLAALPALAQVQPGPTISLSMDAASYLPGAPATITVSLSNSAGTNMSAVSFDLQALGIGLSAASVQIGADPGKTSICYNRTAQELFCLIAATPVSPNNTPLVDGALITIPTTVNAPQAPGVISIAIAQTDGSAPIPDGTDSVEVAVVGRSISFPVTAGPCDLNGDGKIDGNDVNVAYQAFVRAQPGTIPWALTLLNVTRLIDAAITGVCKF